MLRICCIVAHTFASQVPNIVRLLAGTIRVLALPSTSTADVLHRLHSAQSLVAVQKRNGKMHNEVKLRVQAFLASLTSSAGNKQYLVRPNSSSRMHSSVHACIKTCDTGLQICVHMTSHRYVFATLEQPIFELTRRDAFVSAMHAAAVACNTSLVVHVLNNLLCCYTETVLSIHWHPQAAADETKEPEGTSKSAAAAATAVKDSAAAPLTAEADGAQRKALCPPLSSKTAQTLLRSIKEMAPFETYITSLIQELHQVLFLCLPILLCCKDLPISKPTTLSLLKAKS